MTIGDICLKYNSSELSEDDFFRIMFGISKHDLEHDLEEIISNQ